MPHPSEYFYLPRHDAFAHPPRLLTFDEYKQCPVLTDGGCRVYNCWLTTRWLAEADWEFEFPEPEYQARWLAVKKWLREPGVYEALQRGPVPVEELPLWKPRL